MKPLSLIFALFTAISARAGMSAEQFASFWTKWAPEHYKQALSENFWLTQPDSLGWIYQAQFNWDGSEGADLGVGWVVFTLKKGNFIDTENLRNGWLKNSITEWNNRPALYEHFYSEGLVHWAAYTVYLQEIDASFKVVMENVHTEKGMQEIMESLPLEGMMRE